MEYTPVYPEDVAREAYEAALGKCVFGGGWLFNQSDLDVWFDFEGFVVKIPAGTRVRPDGWTLVRNQVSGMDTEEFYGCQSPVNRSGFKFVGGGKLYIYDNLLVYSPDSARADVGYYGPPGRTLEEHIALINTMKLEKATIIADDLSFLPRCPSLKDIHIMHTKGIDHELDFSPLYELPQVESIDIAAPNREPSKGPAIHIDFTRLAGLRSVSVCTNDVYNYHLVPTLEKLWHSNDKRHRDLTDISCSPHLKLLDLLCCSTKSLEGIGRFPLQWVSLSHLRGLEDISALSGCAETLRVLNIDHCGKVKDFSCLQELHNLECLYLDGGQTLPDLSFLRNMPKLRIFTFSMTVEDGDLRPCLDVPYVYCSKIKRHYNLKGKDLPCDERVCGFELI